MELTIAQNAESAAPLQEDIISYYKEMDNSYQNWGNEGVYELHYGYKDHPEVSHHQSLIRMNEVVAQKAGITEGDFVLDAGCGVGASVIWMVKNLKARGHGISLSAYQVEKAQKFARKEKISDQAEFSCQDFSDTSFDDETFDVVWGIESICYAYPKVDFLREARRILKPGGRLVVADYFLRGENFTDVENYSLQKWCEGWAMPPLPSADQYRRDLKATGFGEIHFHNITPYIEESAQNIFLRGKEGYPDDILEKGKNVRQIKHVEACLFQKIALDLGLWKYQIAVAEKV